MSRSLRCVWPAWIQGRVVFSVFNWWLNIPVATKFLQLVCGSSGGAYVVVQGLIWWDMPDQTWSASLETVFWSTSTTAMPRTRREWSMYLVIHQAQVGKLWGSSRLPTRLKISQITHLTFLFSTSSHCINTRHSLVPRGGGAWGQDYTRQCSLKASSCIYRPHDKHGKGPETRAAHSVISS